MAFYGLKACIFVKCTKYKTYAILHRFHNLYISNECKLDQAVKLNVPDEEKFQDGGSLTSMDSGIVENTCKGIRIFADLLLFDCCV